MVYWDFFILEWIMITNELRKIITGKIFWICIFVYVFALLFGCQDALMDRGLMADGTYEMGALYSLENMMSFAVGSVALPLFVCLPGAYLFLEEREGYQYYSQIRTSINRWIIGKMVAAELAGMLMMALTLAIFTAILLLWLPAGIGPSPTSWEGTVYYVFESNQNYECLYLIHCVGCLAVALQWPLCPLCRSVWSCFLYIGSEGNESMRSRGESWIFACDCRISVP